MGPKFYPKKRVNRDKSKFATKQRKCYKMPNLQQQKTRTCFKLMANIFSCTLTFEHGGPAANVIQKKAIFKQISWKELNKGFAEGE